MSMIKFAAGRKNIGGSGKFLEHSHWLSEGSLEVKLPTIWTDEKQRWEESERREE